MTDAVFKELWLHNICDFEPESVGQVLSVFGCSENAFGARLKIGDDYDIKSCGLPKRFADKAANTRYIAKTENLLEYCNRKGIRIITMESEEYPECLKNVYLPPRILFAIGKKLCVNGGVAVAAVGCRKPTPKGKDIAEQLGQNLAASGIIVISGMAEGIDTAVHNGALKGKGITVAVLAGGVEEIYPKSNKGLYYRILERGTILSERPPGTNVKRYFYQQRNRIIVGLAMGTVIVEGDLQSGTSITSRLALESNRDVFAVPGSPTEPNSKLPNSILKDGAIIVDSIESVSEYYRELYPDVVKVPEKPNDSGEVSTSTVKLSEEDLKIVEVLRANDDIAITDVIAMQSGIPIQKLNARLTILCIKGIIRQESGNRFLLVKKG